mmetsp:Transcript_27944/g.90194  ORF Transcript_27944/g.90194 Transcript_27944/m.90194 type:complete len:374 (+) Transcript_27944:541-1662(+)
MLSADTGSVHASRTTPFCLPASAAALSASSARSRASRSLASSAALSSSSAAPPTSAMSMSLSSSSSSSSLLSPPRAVASLRAASGAAADAPLASPALASSAPSSTAPSSSSSSAPASAPASSAHAEWILRNTRACCRQVASKAFTCSATTSSGGGSSTDADGPDVPAASSSRATASADSGSREKRRASSASMRLTASSNALSVTAREVTPLHSSCSAPERSRCRKTNAAEPVSGSRMGSSASRVGCSVAGSIRRCAARKRSVDAVASTVKRRSASACRRSVGDSRVSATEPVRLPICDSAGSWPASRFHVCAISGAPIMVRSMPRTASLSCLTPDALMRCSSRSSVAPGSAWWPVSEATLEVVSSEMRSKLSP